MTLFRRKDLTDKVRHNRQRLRSQLDLPAEPLWLNQVHGTKLVDAAVASPDTEADGAWARQAGLVCAVMTADCLPLLMCRDDAGAVAAVHAGWRGLAAGIVQRAVAALGPPDSLLAWLGPAIGPSAFEVGQEVRDAFVQQEPWSGQSFLEQGDGKYRADLYALARRILIQSGVTRIYGGAWCTWSQPERFYSYRRDGDTGRMASLIWLDSDAYGVFD